MIGDVTIGIQALARGLRLLNKPGVRIYVIVPLGINLLLWMFSIHDEKYYTKCKIFTITLYTNNTSTS